jgi:6-phosphofructokinase 1
LSGRPRDAICLPEQLTDLDELAKAIQRRHDAASSSSVVVVAEGALFRGPNGSSEGLAGTMVSTGLAERTGHETRLTVLGHIQRGGTPTACDRLLATNFDVAAIQAVHSKAFGTMVSVVDEEVDLVSLDEVAAGAREVPATLLEVASRLTVG